MRENICVDFDGVIHIMDGYDKAYDGWEDGKIEGKLAPGAKEAIEKLQKKYNVIIFTTRTDVYNVGNWLLNHGIGKGMNSDIKITNRKPEAVAYIDDKAIRFESWDQVMDDLENYVDSYVDRQSEINKEITKATTELREVLKRIEGIYNINITYTNDISFKDANK